MCWCDCKNPIKHKKCENYYIMNLSTCVCEIKRYLKSIADELVITRDEPTDAVAKLYEDPTKTILTNTYEKKRSCKVGNL